MSNTIMEEAIKDRGIDTDACAQGVTATSHQKHLLQQLLQQNRELAWAGDIKQSLQGIPTGYAQLDVILPEQGWPIGSIVELCLPMLGVGELPLFLHAMAAVTQKQKSVMWVAPPHTPYAPSLQQAGVCLNQLFLVHKQRNSDQPMFWAMEKALRSPGSGMVLGWFASVPDKVMRRLQLSAQAGQTAGVIFRFDQPAYSPASIRLRLESSTTELHINVLKLRHHNSVLGARVQPTSITLKPV